MRSARPHAPRDLAERGVADEDVERHRLTAAWIESLARPEDYAEMLAHHYVSALELGRAVGDDPGPAGERARVALRRAGDRAASLNAFPAAARFYGDALELWPVDDPERPELLFRYGHVLHFAEGRGEAELTEAVQALLEAGDRERAAEAETVLGELAWDRADREACDRHLARAADLVAEAGPSPSTARVLAALTRSYMLAGESRKAIVSGGKPLSLARSLGLPELRAQALSYIGGAQVRLGDPSGIRRQRRAVEIARAIKSPHLARWLNNYASQLFEQRSFVDALPLWEEAQKIARRDGALTLGRFIDSFQALILQEQGRWAEALENASAFIEAAQEKPHYLEGVSRQVRGMIRLARGDVAGALTDAERGLEIARRARDPQVVGPQLAVHATLLAEVGDLERAAADADEILAMGRHAPLEQHVVFLATAFETLNRVDDLARLRELANATRWREALDRHLTGDPGGAADVCEEIGVLATSARWRLLAGKLLAAQGRQTEADLQLERALAFFRSVDATRYVCEAESLSATG
jgi:tetratricopeptide (TPR) repeat protein